MGPLVSGTRRDVVFNNLLFMGVIYIGLSLGCACTPRRTVTVHP